MQVFHEIPRFRFGSDKNAPYRIQINLFQSNLHSKNTYAADVEEKQYV